MKSVAVFVKSIAVFVKSVVFFMVFVKSIRKAHEKCHFSKDHLQGIVTLCFIFSCRIETPIVGYQGEVCVTFKYHMYGDQLGQLAVYGKQSGLRLRNYIEELHPQVYWSFVSFVSKDLYQRQ